MFSVALRLNGLLERSIKRIENLAGQTDWQTRITVRHKSGNGILILFPIFFFPETSFFQDQQKLRLELSQQEMAFLCAKIMVYIQCFLNPCHTWMSVCPFNGTYKMFVFSVWTESQNIPRTVCCSHKDWCWWTRNKAEIATSWVTWLGVWPIGTQWDTNRRVYCILIGCTTVAILLCVWVHTE
jgi:hypothetical protein